MMTKTTLGVLSVGLVCAILLGLRTIFFTPGSTVTEEKHTASFSTQSHTSAPDGVYVPFDPKYGLQGREWSAQRVRQKGKSEKIN